MRKIKKSRCMRCFLLLFWLALPGLCRSAETNAASNAAIEEEELYFFYDTWNVIYNKEDLVREIPDSIRIASYNLENFTDGYEDPPERTPKRLAAHVKGAAKIIAELDPDIIILQELENKYALRLLNKALTNAYPLGYTTFFRHRWGEIDTLNIGVLSRIPLKDVRTIRFTKANGADRPIRGMLAFEVEVGPDDHRLLLYGIHLKSNYGNDAANQRQRKRSLEILMTDMAAVASNAPGREYEVLVLGDTNVDPDNEQFKKDVSLKPLSSMSDLWRGRPLEERITIPTRYGDPEMEFPPAAFDRIFVSKNLKKAPWVAGQAQVLQKGCHTNDSSVLPGDKGHVSDHYPVWVDIHRKKPSPASK